MTKAKKLAETPVADRHMIKCQLLCIGRLENDEECTTYFEGMVRTGSGAKMPACPKCHRTSTVFVAQWIEVH